MQSLVPQVYVPRYVLLNTRLETETRKQESSVGPRVDSPWTDLAQSHDAMGYD